MEPLAKLIIFMLDNFNRLLMFGNEAFAMYDTRRTFVMQKSNFLCHYCLVGWNF